MSAQIRVCGEFIRSMKKFANDAQVVARVKEFKQKKQQAPLEPFGSKDYPFVPGSPLAGWLHAGLSFDISMVYKVHGGGKERFVDMYGVYNHDDIGAGQPSNPNKSKAIAKVWKNQEFQLLPQVAAEEPEDPKLKAKREAIARAERLQQQAISQGS